MVTGLNARWFQRIAAMVAVYFIGDAVNVEWAGGEAWWIAFCFLAIMLVIEFLAFRHGVATGINIYRSLNADQRRDMDRLFEGQEQ